MEPYKTTVCAASGADPHFYRRRTPAQAVTRSPRRGRPRQQLDMNRVRQLALDGMKLKAAAKILGVTPALLRRRTLELMEEQRCQD